MSNTPARKGSSLRTPRTKAAPVIKSAAPAAPPVPRPGATPVTTTPAAVPPLVLPDDSPGVKERIDRALAAQRAAEATLAAAEARAVAAETRAVRAERTAVFIGEKVTAPSVQRAMGRDYDSYAAEVGDKAVDFATWVRTEAKTDPLYAPHFAQTAPAAAPAAVETPAAAPAGTVTPPAAAAPVATPAAPNPNGGTVAQPVAQGRIITDADSRTMDDATFNLNAAAVRQQLESGADGFKVILPQPRKRTP